MAEQGSYHVSGTRPKDTSFRSFICALLVFLVLCIVIYLSLMLAGLADKDSKSSYRSNKESEKLSAQNNTKEKEVTTMVPKIRTTSAYKTTQSVTYKTTTLQPGESRTEDVANRGTDKALHENSTRKYVKNSTEDSPTIVFGTTESTIGKSTATDSATQTVSFANQAPIGKTSSSSESTTPTVLTSTNRSRTGNSTTRPQIVTKVYSTKLDTTTETNDIGTSTTENETDKYDSTSHSARETVSFANQTTTGKTSSTSSVSTTQSILLSIAKSLTGNTETASTPDSSTVALGSTESDIGKSTIEQETGKYDSTTEYVTQTAGIVYQAISGKSSSGSPETTTQIVLSTTNRLTGNSNTTSDVTVDTTTKLTTTPVTDASASITGATGTAARESTTESETLPTFHQYNAVNATTQAVVFANQKTTENSTSTNYQSTTESALSTEVSTVGVPLTTTGYVRTTTVAYSATPMNATTMSPTTPGMSIKPTLPKDECNTSECRKAASQMLYLMNHDEDPCENFYNFACGGQKNYEDTFEDNMKVLLNYMASINGSSEKYLQDFKKFYESCVEHKREITFAVRMEFIRNVSSNYSDFNELVVELILTQAMPFFDIGLNIDEQQAYTFQLTLPGESSLKVNVKGWTLMDQIKDQCLNEQKYLAAGQVVDLDKMNADYKDCQKRRLKDIARNFKDDIVQNHQDNILNEENLSNLINLLDGIQKLLPSDKSQIDKTSMSIKDLNRKYDIINWKFLLEHLTFNRTFSEDDYIEVLFSKYMNNVFDMLNTTYFNNLTELSSLLQLYSRLQLYQNLVVASHNEDAEIQCVGLATKVMPDVVSTITYSHVENLHEKFLKVVTLFGDLKNQFGESLQKSKLDDQSKDRFSQKLNRIKFKTITTGDYNATRKHYEQVNMTDKYEINARTLFMNYRQMIYSLEGSKASASNLLIYFVDPFYSKPVSFYPSEYIIAHPAVYEGESMKLPENMLLSKLGLHLGIELAKHFDPTGRLFFTDSIISSSDNFYNSLVEQTSNVLLSNANGTYKIGKQTFTFQTQPPPFVNEMIVDNAAMKLIYGAYLQLKSTDHLPWVSCSYSTDKAFFISAAQEFCRETTAPSFMIDMYETFRQPSPLKIQNIVSNTLEFSNIFNCAQGSAMQVPKNMIAQFPNIQEDYDNNYETNYTN